MRKIQFRAWTGKKMIGWEHLLTEFTSDWFNNGWKIMQFTGLEDKNGTEIYEGDIVRGVTGYLFRVVFKEGHFGYLSDENHPAKNKFFMNISTKFDEVIGNIYENPELLNSDKNGAVSDTRKVDSSNDVG